MTNQFSLKNWITASRPKTLPAAIAPVMVGTGLAYHDYHFNFVTAIITFLAAICIQIGTNFSNDLSDFLKGTDATERTGPIRAAQAGLLTISQLKAGIVFIFSIAIIFGSYLAFIGGLPIIIIGITSIAAGILYTAGPYPFGYYGLGDFFVFLFFGIIAVAGTYFLQTGYVTSNSLYCGCIMGCLAAAILVVNNLRDADTDILTRKKTLAVIFGKTFSKIEFSILVFTPYLFLIYLYLQLENLSVWLPIFTLPISLSLIIKIYSKTGSDLNTVLEQTAKLLFIFAILLCLGLII